jgi:hypothetical protein
MRSKRTDSIEWAQIKVRARRVDCPVALVGTEEGMRDKRGEGECEARVATGVILALAAIRNSVYATAKGREGGTHVACTHERVKHEPGVGKCGRGDRCVGLQGTRVWHACTAYVGIDDVVATAVCLTKCVFWAEGGRDGPDSGK